MRNSNTGALSGNPAPMLQLAPRKIAIFRALQLGDMLCAVPALRALRAALPAAHITLVGLPWACQFAARFEKYIDDFVAFPGHPALPEQVVRADELDSFYAGMRARHYELAIQLHGNGQTSNQVLQALGAAVNAGYVPGELAADGNNSSWFMPYPELGAEPERLLGLMEYLGAPAQDNELEFPITASDVRELEASGLQRGLKDLPAGYVCLHPGARLRHKCWPPQCFAQVADHLAEKLGVAIVLTGSDKETDLTSAVAGHMRTATLDAAGPLSIGAMAALMAGARLLVCNDTGVSHIAAGLCLPSVVIFSSADIRRWAPQNSTLHRALWDPDGRRADAVLHHAGALLKSAWSGRRAT